MNSDIIKGRCKQLGACLKTRLAELTDDDVGLLQG